MVQKFTWVPFYNTELEDYLKNKGSDPSKRRKAPIGGEMIRCDEKKALYLSSNLYLLSNIQKSS